MIEHTMMWTKNSDAKRVDGNSYRDQHSEAIGRLSGGIAHEISNCITYLDFSLQVLASTFQEACSLISKYQSLYVEHSRGQGSEGMSNQVGDGRETTDVSGLQMQLTEEINCSFQGIQELTKIVQAIREFSKQSNGKREFADINTALLMTLTLARNEYKYVADIETELGELPLVKCFIGDISLAFLHLILNATCAIGAVGHGENGRKGKISIRTKNEIDSVLISIWDTGCGIPEDIQTRVFDSDLPGEDPERGKHRGLVVVQSIVVERHGGKLFFDSRVGEGTNFHIQLPVNGNPSVAPGN